MKAGKLRHRVTVERPVRTKNSYGEDEETWELLATVWGAVEPLSGRELWNAQQAQSLTTHKVTIRMLQGVTSDMRMIFKGRQLNILSVQNLEERNREIQMMCMEHS